MCGSRGTGVGMSALEDRRPLTIVPGGEIEDTHLPSDDIRRAANSYQHGRHLVIVGMK